MIVDEKLIQDFSRSKKEPKWMTEFRLSALTFFRTLSDDPGAPVPELAGLDFSKGPGLIAGSKADRLINSRWSWIKENPVETSTSLSGAIGRVNGQRFNRLTPQHVYDSGVIVADMHEVLEKDPDIFKSAFAFAAKVNSSRLTALNSALWSGGTMIVVPPDVKLEGQIFDLNVVDAENSALFTRLVVVAMDGSSVSISHGTFGTKNSCGLVSEVIEVWAYPDSEVSLNLWHTLPSGVSYRTNEALSVESYGQIHFTTADLGSADVVRNLNGDLASDGAGCVVRAASVLGGEQISDLSIRLVHRGRDTLSDIVHKGIYFDNAKALFRPSIAILDGATESEMLLTSSPMMRGNQASYKMLPRIDVRNSRSCVQHVASVNRLDDDLLFYLSTRGLSRKAAMELLARGIFGATTIGMARQNFYKMELAMDIRHRLNELE